MADAAKILLIDIETAPNVAYVWGAWQQNVGANQWVRKGHIMSFASKWLGQSDDEIIYVENRKLDDTKIIKAMFKLLDEADMVVAHNGQKFDLPTIIGRGVVKNLKPPSPYFVVDTLLTARREFRFVQNSLENLCNELNLPRKLTHKKYPGFELWLGCLRNEDEAWAEMREYNIHDVISLEALYLRLRPYMKSHPNVLRGLTGETTQCPKCASESIQWRGYVNTKAGLEYRRFVCKDCGTWGRSKTSEKDRGKGIGRVAQ